VSTEQIFYPPQPYASLWWVALAACLGGCAAIVWWCRRTLHRLARPLADDDLLESIRLDTIARIALIESRWRAGEVGAADASSRLGAEVRRFVGIVTGGDTDYRVLAEAKRLAVKDSRLDPVVDLWEVLEDAAFSLHSEVSVASLSRRAREVVATWR
jgi:hypothetical protein